ncbi:hypothetical protein BH23BAC1_BH23BAC1_45920 [soil metagenome]
MVQTSIARPTGILQDYIQSFELREFGKFNEIMKKPCHAFQEVSISLFIDSKKPPFEPLCNNLSTYFYEPYQSPFAGVMGIQSTMKGFFVFQGKFKILNIQFKPIGFSSIFQIPAALINDQFFDAEEVLNQELQELHEKLHENITFREMVFSAEKFFLGKLASNQTLYKSESIRKASNSLITEPNNYSMEQLAYHSNMSLKTFERKFTDLVGISPKLYARIRRFNQALALKQYHKELTWLDVCVKTGYFDLNHLNKDFKAFAGNPPASFFKNTHPPYENFSSL